MLKALSRGVRFDTKKHYREASVVLAMRGGWKDADTNDSVSTFHDKSMQILGCLSREISDLRVEVA